MLNSAESLFTPRFVMMWGRWEGTVSLVNDDAPMQVSVDPDLCQGSGWCIRTAPTVFAERPDGIAAVRHRDRITDGPVSVPPESIDQVLDASAVCPAGAINTLG